jgi:pyruvate dehydrogenase E2 component (dihydrolipoamide acetyltransferase)
LATDVTMPRLSDSMEEGTILKWLVSEGDEVERGQELVEIETDKANMTYESDTGGTLVEVMASEGDTLPIGEVIAKIGEPGEAAGDGAGGERSSEEEGSDEQEEQEESQAAVAADQRPEEDEEESQEEEAGEPVTAEESGNGDEPAERPGKDAAERQDAGAGTSDGAGDGRVKASPVARRVAREAGVDLGTLEGSGPGGRIVKADVEAAAEAPGGGESRDGEAAGAAEPEADREERAAEREEPTEEKEGERKPTRPAAPEPQPAGEAGAKGDLHVQELTRLQQTVSRRMAESKATAPDYALTAEVDMSACVELRARLKEIADPAPSFNDMVVKACAGALRDFPRVNGAYRDGRFERYSRVNVGVAVAAQDTLVVPTLFDADQRSLGDVATRTRALIEKVRDGSITPPELSGGTFTVSNLGMYGIDSFSAVINPPQAALLAVGAMKKRPVVEESGRIVARETMSVTLVCDHRILYGADGAQFLARVRELLEQPLALAL